MKMIDRVKINAPIKIVFDYISNPEKQKLWMDGLMNTEFINKLNESNPVGTQFKQHLIKGHRKITYEFQGEILEYTFPNLYAVRIKGQGFTAVVHYNLEEIEGKTQLNSEAVMEFEGNFIARFIGKMAAHHNKQDIKKLIALVEKV